MTTRSEFDPEKVAALPTFNVADHLRTPEDLAAFLTEALAEEDMCTVVQAMRDAALGVGMTKVAYHAGIERSSIYKALMPRSKPRIHTFLGLVKAAGCRIVIVPLDQSVPK